jgi:hypothetical protein
VVIIDDEWAMVGSANLDGASLDSYGDDFSGRLARRVFREVRNFDVSLVITRPKRTRGPNTILELRRRLWMEHLRSDLSHSVVMRPRAKATAVRSPAKSTEQPIVFNLAQWKSLAERNIAALNALNEAEPLLTGSFILPYSRRARPRAQLADVGVEPSAPLDLEFDPGWLEINFSPNWVRNMFL